MQTLFPDSVAKNQTQTSKPQLNLFFFIVLEMQLLFESD